MMKLNCTGCGKTYPYETAHPRCRLCEEPLELRVGDLSTARIHTQQSSMITRYRDFLPFAEGHEHLSLGEGGTPLISSRIASKSVGIYQLLFKNETHNPTWSFKDRGTLTGLIHAVSLGFKQIGTVSTGNMAPSVAAYCAHAGLQAYVLVSADMPTSKIAPISVYAPELIRVNGDYGSLYYESLKIGNLHGIYFINSDVPFRVEGSKTIAFEICEQTRFDIPDMVVVPTSAGGNVRGIIKGFEEFKEAGLIQRLPKIVVAQAAGCAPIVQAYQTGARRIKPWIAPDTIAHAIENPFPPSGNQMLRKLEETDGLVVAVSDKEILTAQELLAQDGIFGQPAAAVPLAAVARLRADGRLSGYERVLCVVTGSGLKYPEALANRSHAIQETTLARLHDIFEKE